MAFNIENGSGSTLDINDFGITLATSEITDLALRSDPQLIALSAQVGNELETLITSGDVIIKDPLDGTTDLSVANGLAVARSQNDPHWRVGGGARIGDISDVTFTTPVLDDVLQFNGTDWINIAPSAIGAGASFSLEWRFSTSIVASDPGSGRFRYDDITLASVTNIYFDDFADSGFDVGTVFSLLAAGSKIYIQENDSSTSAVLFTVTGSPVDNIGWWTIPVSVDDSGILHTNNRKCSAIFFTASSGSAPVIQEDTVALANPPHSTINYGLGLLATDAGSNVADIDLDAGVDDLNDATITGITDNDTLKYDSGTGQWINVQGVPSPPSGGEIVISLVWAPIGGISSTAAITITEFDPLVSEGAQVWTNAIDIQNAASTIRLESSFEFTASTASMELVFAIFRGSVCVGTTIASNPNKDTGASATMIIYDTPGAAGSTTYELRVGKNGGPGTWYVNSLPGFTTPLGGTLEQNAYTISEIGVVP